MYFNPSMITFLIILISNSNALLHTLVSEREEKISYLPSHEDPREYLDPLAQLKNENRIV